MSLLDTQSQPTPEQIAKQNAVHMKVVPRHQFEVLFRAWQQGIEALWGANAPTALILAELGTDAGELFQLCAATTAFLEQLKPGCTAETVALIRPFTIAQDGSVTLNE